MHSKPSLNWLKSYRHVLNEHDALIVAQAFIANATEETRNVSEFFTNEFQNQVSDFFIMDQIPNSLIFLQEWIDKLNFEKEFSSFNECMEMYTLREDSIQKSIQNIYDDVDSETKKMLLSEGTDLEWGEFKIHFLKKKKELNELQKELKQVQEELSFLQDIYEESLQRFQKKDRLKIYDISDDAVFIGLAPIEY